MKNAMYGEFATFLGKWECLNEFISEHRKAVKNGQSSGDSFTEYVEMMKSMSERSMVSSGFIWEKSKLGEQYWRLIDKLWQLHLKSHKIDTSDIKYSIIENFIDYYTSDEDERDTMKDEASNYVDDDWVDEVGQSLGVDSGEDSTYSTIRIIQIEKV